jgi:hypothetical protein
VPSTPIPLRRLPLAAALVLAAGTASADRVTPKKGAVLKGSVVRTDTDVVVNRYRSTTAGMTYGVVRLPLAEVRKIDEEPDPEDVVRRRARDLAPGDAAGRVGLARYALSQRLKLDADRLLEEALALDPKVADGAALYGGLERFEAAAKSNPALRAAWRADLAAYLRLEDGKARRAAADAMAARHGTALRPELLERARRSSLEPTGFSDGVAARLRAEKHPGATYSIRVPATYDPLVPTPLLVGLHDGRGGGRDGRTVVGRGRDADGLFAGGAERNGWILVCPTALVVPWSDPANDAWLADVLEEVLLRWNVDLDRMFLAGQGGGADGVWSFCAKRPGLFAGIAPTTTPVAGTGLKALRDARTRVFLYHSEDDSVVGPGYSRAAADALLDLGADVTYLELPDRGHSFPPEADGEMFDLFRRARRFDPKRTSAWPVSSFARPVTADERRDLGDPLAGLSPAPAK